MVRKTWRRQSGEHDGLMLCIALHDRSDVLQFFASICYPGATHGGHRDRSQIADQYRQRAGPLLESFAFLRQVVIPSIHASDAFLLVIENAADDVVGNAEL